MTRYWNDADIPNMMLDSPNEMTAITTGEFPVPVTGKCLFYESDELKLDAPQSASVTMYLARVYVQTSLFGFVDGGSTVVVDGISYIVWKRLQEGDGAVTQFLLRAVAENG